MVKAALKIVGRRLISAGGCPPCVAVWILLAATMACAQGIPGMPGDQYGLAEHVIEGSVAGVQLALNRGADPNHVALQGSPVLQIAAYATSPEEDRLEIIRLLLDSGASVEILDDLGRTPLFYADSGDVAAVLVEAGADVGARDSAGRTPLHTASNSRVVEALIAFGADVSARDVRGRTPLHNVRRGDVAAALIAAGGDVRANDYFGMTPLHEVLTSFGGLADAFLGMGDFEYAERTIVSAGSRTVVVLEIFIQAGADVNARDAEGWTPLHLAAGFGTSEMVHALLEAGANARARTLSGALPFDMAQLNEILKGSSAYWLLNDARF